jgi:hypothetical protein
VIHKHSANETKLAGEMIEFARMVALEIALLSDRRTEWCRKQRLANRIFPAILLEMSRRRWMGNSQKRAIQNYRSRLSARGLARFEVLGLARDRDLIRSLARRLADNGPDAMRIRSTVNQTISGEPPKTGGIVAALRRSALVGAGLDLGRSRVGGRRVDL